MVAKQFDHAPELLASLLQSVLTFLAILTIIYLHGDSLTGASRTVPQNRVTELKDGRKR